MFRGLVLAFDLAFTFHRRERDRAIAFCYRREKYSGTSSSFDDYRGARVSELCGLERGGGEGKGKDFFRGLSFGRPEVDAKTPNRFARFM